MAFAAQAGPSTAAPPREARPARAHEGSWPQAQDQAAGANDLQAYQQRVQHLALFPRGADDPGRRHLMIAARAGADRVVRFLLADPRAHGRGEAMRTARQALRDHRASGGDAETSLRYEAIIRACERHRARHGSNPLAGLRRLFRSDR